ncbi:MAG: ATP-grasp domain-containing protein [Chloroflexi bacterium]|nr:ATP-grasp domain-containing protein [Chloroflexota bacterium]
MRIAVLANLKKNAPTWDGMVADQWDDLDSSKTTDSMIAVLRAAGHEADFFEAQIAPPHNLMERLLAYQPDLCFNISESHFGDGREAQIPAMLEMLRIPYTGSKVLTLALALDKPMTKRLLWYHGLPTPEFQVFEQADEPIDEDLLDESGELRFPLFVKPSREGTSMGISGESIVYTVAQLREQLRKMIARYNQSMLVEHFIKGREVTIGLLGNLKSNMARRINERVTGSDIPEGLTFLPALEVDTHAYGPEEGGLYTNRMKVELADDFRYLCPAPLTPEQEHDLQRLAAAVFRVMGCKDVARVDFRLDERQHYKPYILEINPLPGLNPGYSDLCLQALAGGWSYERLINTIVELAASREGLAQRPLKQAVS